MQRMKKNGLTIIEGYTTKCSLSPIPYSTGDTTL